MINSYQKVIASASKEYGVPDSLLTAQLQRESAFNPNAISSAGAEGIAQFMPATATSIGLSDPFNPDQAIPAAAKYDAQLYDATGNWQDALIAYNEGPTAEAQGLDYTQSQNYATDILTNAGMGSKTTDTSGGGSYETNSNGQLTEINFGGDPTSGSASTGSGSATGTASGSATGTASGSGSCPENDTPILSIAGYALITPCGLFDLVVGILGIVFIVAGFKSDAGKMIMQAAKSIPLE